MIKKMWRDYKSKRHAETSAWCDTITFDDSAKRYRLDRRTVKERDIPQNALKITGGKNHYGVIACEQPVRKIRREDGSLETCAISNYLYMINNSINDALASTWKPKYIDVKLLTVLAIGAAIFGYIIISRVG